MRFKIRASASGKLMTKSRSKDGALSKTALSYVQDWYKEQIYGVKKNIDNKYLRKGISVEDNAIEYAASELGWLFAEKNEEYFEDSHFCGTPDVILDDTIIDIKSSWDCFTFPLFEDEIPNKDYYYQLQTYMALTGLKKAQLVYVLMDTPESIERDAVSYESVESKYRIKIFDVDYDEEVVESMRDKVQYVRDNVINTLEK